MISTKFTIENQVGESITLNDHSDPQKVIALQSYPQFQAGVKNNEVRKQGQHGVWDFNNFYDKKLIIFEGVIVGRNEKEVDELKQKLNTVVSLPARPRGDNDLVTVSWKGIDEKHWQIDAKLFDSINYNRRMKQTYRLDFRFILKAPDPFIIGKQKIRRQGTRGYIGSGASFPLEMPTIMGEAEVNVMTIDYKGQVDAEPKITLYGEDQGDITNPRIIDLTRDIEFKVETTLEGSDDYIVIDSKDGTVVDSNGDDISGLIASGSQFITLPAGVAELSYKSDEDPLVTLQSPTAVWNLSFRERKI